MSNLAEKLACKIADEQSDLALDHPSFTHDKFVEMFDEVLRQEWTTEQPTKPGQYWYRVIPRAEEVVQIYEHQDGALLMGRVNEEEPIWLDDVYGEWAGPLEPPA